MSPRQKEDTERINVFLSETVLEKIKKEAAEKGMTVSGLVRFIVMDHYSEKK